MQRGFFSTNSEADGGFKSFCLEDHVGYVANHYG